MKIDLQIVYKISNPNAVLSPLQKALVELAKFVERHSHTLEQTRRVELEIFLEFDLINQFLSKYYALTKWALTKRNGHASANRRVALSGADWVRQLAISDASDVKMRCCCVCWLLNGKDDIDVLLSSVTAIPESKWEASRNRPEARALVS
jgi:hypothetical protein